MNNSLDSTFATDTVININSSAKAFLRSASKWANFIAIIGFIMLGLMFIASFFMIGMASSFSRIGMSPMIMGITYLAMTVLYFFPTYYLFQFARKIKEGLSQQSEEGIAKAFENLKSMFKFLGIFTIIVIGFYIIILLFALIVGASNF